MRFDFSNPGTQISPHLEALSQGRPIVGLPPGQLMSNYTFDVGPGLRQGSGVSGIIWTDGLGRLAGTPAAGSARCQSIAVPSGYGTQPAALPASAVASPADTAASTRCVGALCGVGYRP